MGSSTNHDQEVDVIEPHLGYRRPSVGAQIANLWSEFKRYPEGRGKELSTDRLARVLRREGNWEAELVDLFDAFLQKPNAGSTNPALEAAFSNFVSHLRVYDADDVAVAAADDGYEAAAAPEAAAANNALRPQQAAPPSVATESLRRDLRRRLRSL
jgi:hypothetical protein